MGLWSDRSHLFPVKRGSKDWDKVVKAVTGCNEWDYDPALAEKWQANYKDRIQEQLKRAKASWDSYDTKERARRIMAAEDGR